MKKEKNKFFKMTAKKYDKYMCETYPFIFQDRNKSMSETAMCWGFSIGKGWYKILDDVCKKISLIHKLVGIYTIMGQVKEKFGSARFYHSPTCDKKCKLNDEEKKLWMDIVEDLMDKAEGATCHTCAECGEYYYDQITIGHWVYDICGKCFVKIHPDRIKLLETWRENREFKDFVNNIIYDNYDPDNKSNDKFKKIKNKLLQEYHQHKDSNEKNKEK